MALEVDPGFERIDYRFDRLEARFDRFEKRIEERFDLLQRAMVTTMAGFIAAFASLAAAAAF